MNIKFGSLFLRVYLLFTQRHQILPNSRPLSCPHPCRHQFSIDDSTLPIALRKGVRRCTDHPIGNYVTYEELSPSYKAFATSLDDTQVPNTIQEAFKISEWKKVVQDEIDALKKNGTWTITDLPVGKRLVGYKWIFTIKYKADGSVVRFKAHLVARGFT